MPMPTIKVKIDAGRQGTIEKHMSFGHGYNAELHLSGGLQQRLRLAQGHRWYARQASTSQDWHVQQGAFCHHHYDAGRHPAHWLLPVLFGFHIASRCSVMIICWEHPFTSAFAVKLNFRNEYSEIGCPTTADGRSIPAFQKVPMYFKGKHIMLEVKGSQSNICRRRD